MRLATVAGPIVCLVLLGGAGVTRAAEPAAPAQAQNPYMNCTCRAQGRSYRLGERVCLSTPKGYRVAECRMQQNVTSWSISTEDCSVSAGRVLQLGGRAPEA